MTELTRCRPGDLALIVQDESGYEENIGRFVAVHGPAQTVQGLGLSWVIVPLTSQPYAVRCFRGKLYDREIKADDGIVHTRCVDAAHPTGR